MDSIYEHYYHKTRKRHNIIVPPVAAQIRHIINIEEKALNLRETITSERKCYNSGQFKNRRLVCAQFNC